MLIYLEDLQEIEKKIEITRTHLHDLINHAGETLFDPQIVALSQTLDRLILDYIRMTDRS